LSEKVLVIANPAASGGTSLEVYHLFSDFLESQAIPFQEYFTKGTDDEEAIKAVVEQNNPAIISVIGGDGTLNIVLNSLPNLNFKIHLIPAGTGNDFSKELYDGLNEEQVFQLILNKVNLKKVDLWRVNNKRFINCFGAGFDGEIAQRMYGKSYFLPSKLKYWFEILRSIFTYKSTELTINGKTQACFMMAVANGKVYGGGFQIAPLADATDGLADLIIVGKVPILKRFLYLPIIERGKHLELNVITYSQNSSVTISSKHPLPAQIDGEPMLADKYEISREGEIGFLVS
jgi:diacylglycerol kinase (ATP)